MEARYRWLSITPLTRKHIALVASAMQRKTYSSSSENGFVLSSVRSDLIEGRFVERFEFVEELLDPFGTPLKVNRIEFAKTEFRISTDYPEIEFRNPARSVKVLLNQLASSLDFKAAISGINIAPLDWVRAIEDQDRTFAVLGLRTRRFTVSNATGGVLELDGTQDVRDDLRRVLPRREVAIDSLLCICNGGAEPLKAELRANATARVFSAVGHEQATLLRTALGRCRSTEDSEFR